MKQKEKALVDFLEYKEITAHTKQKINAYKYFISMFLNSTNKSLKDISEKDVINFINIKSKHYAIGSMNEIKIMLKSFLYWYYTDHPTRFRNLKKICRGQRKEKTYSPDQMLSKKDVEKLVQAEYDPRWKVYFLLFFYGGFRPKEVCELEWKDILFDKEGAYIKVYVKKNGKSFEKFVPENVSFYLKQLQDNDSKYVFPTKRTKKKGISVGDKPQTTSGVYQRLIPLAKRVLNKHVNPYILRHSIATILYNRDDLKDNDVAMQMGHSKEMRETYTNLSVEKLRERMKKIYIKAEELPPEKRKELEKEIEELKNDVGKLSNSLQLQINFLQDLREKQLIYEQLKKKHPKEHKMFIEEYKKLRRKNEIKNT